MNIAENKIENSSVQSIAHSSSKSYKTDNCQSATDNRITNSVVAERLHFKSNEAFENSAI